MVHANDEASNSGLTVQIRGLRQNGQVRLALFDKPAGFPSIEHASRTMLTDARDGQAELIIDPIGKGRYAIAIFQDVNADGVLNKGAFGMPTEPYGFSNDARGSFGPPSFQQAEFEFPSQQMMAIQLK